MDENNTLQNDLNSKPRILKWFKKLLAFLVFLIFAMIILLQFSEVQTWLSTKVTKYISEATNTKVTAERLKISPFDGIILHNFNISDQQGDTILHGGALNISLRKNLFFLLNNTLDLSYLGVKNITLNIITEVGESKSNIQKFIDNLSSSPKENDAKSTFDFDLKEIDLSDISVLIHNKNKGKYTLFKLVGGAVDINYIDLICNEFDINSIVLDRPSCQIHTYNYSCNLTDELTIEQKSPELSEEPESEKIPMSITLREFIVSDGRFGVSNEILIPDSNFKSYLDYDNFYTEKVNLIFKDLSFRNNSEFFAKLESLSARDNTGFEIKKIKCDTINIKSTSAELLSYSIEMGNTIIRNSLKFSYADLNAFDDFAYKVAINADFINTQIYLDDLVHFVRSLSRNTFVKSNLKEIIEINGRYFGKINNLGGRDVSIKLGNKLSLAGSFNTRDLLDADNAVLNIRLDRFSTSMRKLKMIIPSFAPPENFNQLGSINFTGRFDGYLEDFVAYGKVKSDIGTATMDMRLDVTQGSNKARYSGTLNLQNFNLGIWSGNSDLGLVNFNSKVDDGKGLTLNAVQADLAATVKSLSFKKYTYKDFVLDGRIDKNTFSGSFKINDENIDFIFDGTFEYLNDKAFLNFKSDVRKIDLRALNLSTDPLTFKAKMDINFSGTNLNDFLGDLNISQIDMVVKDSSYRIEKLDLSAKNTIRGTRQILLTSDLGEVSLDGEYDLPNVVKAIKKVIHVNYPYITKAWKDDVADFKNNQRFTFNIYLTGSKNFLSLVGLNNSSFRKLSLKGKLDTYKDEFTLTSVIPLLKINNDSINDLQLLVNSSSKIGDVQLFIDSTFALGKHFNPIEIQTRLRNDTVDFVLKTEKLIDSFENFDVKGRLIPHPKGFKLTLADNLLMVLGTKWNINPRNSIILGDSYFNLDNLIFSDGLRSVEINDVNNKGLSLDVNNIDLDLLNAVIKYDKMKFGGATNISAKLQDLYADDKEISGYISVPRMTINGDPYGAVYIDVTKSINMPLKANISIGDFLAVKGTYDLKEKKIESRIKLREAPMKIIEYLLKTGIKNTEGYIDADIAFGGPTDQLLLSGSGSVNKGKTTIIYTGATYFFDKQKLKISNTEINLNGARISDQNGNAATIKGGLVHNMFKDFGVNASISGNNIIGLNTTKTDNRDYYGYGVGRLSADFSGSFERVDMKINAVTGPGTKLYIPVDNNQSAIDKSFIKFVKKGNTKESIAKINESLGGIEIEMTMTLTPDAEVSLIFNESKGDIIRGRGRGNLKIDITRQGDFEMFGDYEIEQGEYLFTVSLLPVAKPFVVERGGRITWTGDPVNATLDITANYRTRTPIKPFIEEYLTQASENTQNLAEQRSEVDLRLKLGGTLFKPEIKFDLLFPNLVSDLSTLTDSKLRLLRNNELELNSQVLGLIVFNAFLPSNRVSDIFGASALQSAGINTLSEFLSSQLSFYITNLLNSALEEDGLLAGIDFELGLRNNNLALGSAATNNILPNEIEVRLKNKFRFMDERFSLNVGGNYVFQNQGITINQVLPDFALEFLLTEDRKLKVRLYGKYDLDPITITGLREKYGLGVAYRTEFGSMLDFEKKVKSKVTEIIKK